MYKGLTTKEAEELLKRYGYNRIESDTKRSSLKIFIEQFESPIILLLIFAAIISMVIDISKNEPMTDSFLIITIVFISGILGFIQEYKAERILEKLKEMANPKAKVFRDGELIIINSQKLVPGDIVKIIEGDVIPADCKVLEGTLKINESILTGESKNVEKKNGDIVYAGTYVNSGNAICKVIRTGKQTEIGKIAKKLKEIKDDSPFQRQMKKFTDKIVFLSVMIIIVMFFISLFKFSLLESLLLAVSLAVAAIPEDLPIVTTIALSLGAKEMAKRNALIRKLSAIETIGRVNIICTDKTGTLTKGELEIKEIFTKTKDKQIIYDICFNCNNAKFVDNIWIGDETDIALKKFSKNRARSYKKIQEIPFDSNRKMHVVLTDENLVFVKGAPEVVLDRCKYILVDSKIQNIENYKDEIFCKNKELCERGYRVIAVAYKNFDGKLDRDLIFVGLISFYDPPKGGVKEAIKECKESGIKVIMITGDNPITAKSIGESIGITTKEVLTGDELDKMDHDKILEKIKNGVNIFARVNPFHKLKILEALKKEDNIVAMTGDGVNDALSLKRADVGISMGKKGTEVAKQASDIILLDDNFKTIVEAIKQGKTTFENIKKSIFYLLSCNVSEILVVSFGTIMFPFILLYPIQILWINLITDGLPALGFAFDKVRDSILKEKLEKDILSKKSIKKLFIIGSIMTINLLLLFLIGYSLKGYKTGITYLFTGFIFFELSIIYLIERKELFKNKFLMFTIFVSVILQIVITYTANQYFEITSLTAFDWIIILLFTYINLLVIDFSLKAQNGQKLSSKLK